MASATPSWVILPRDLRVDRLPDGTDLSLAPAAPPLISSLTVSTRVSPHPHPRVVATDLSAGLLLIVTPPPPPPGRDHRDPRAVAAPPAYFVLDVASAKAHRVHCTGVRGYASLGVISAPDGGGFMVVRFQRFVDNPIRARLCCFSSQTGCWATKDVNNPLPTRTWAFRDFIPHDGKLWWQGRSHGVGQAAAS